MWIILLIFVLLAVVLVWLAYIAGRARGFSDVYKIKNRHSLQLVDYCEKIIAELELAEKERGVDYTIEKKLLRNLIDS